MNHTYIVHHFVRSSYGKYFTKILTKIQSIAANTKTPTVRKFAGFKFYSKSAQTANNENTYH